MRGAANEARQRVAVWRLEHATPSLIIAEGVFEEAVMPKLAEGIGSVEVDRKIPGYNVGHTMLFG